MWACGMSITALDPLYQLFVNLDGLGNTSEDNIFRGKLLVPPTASLRVIWNVLFFMIYCASLIAIIFLFIWAHNEPQNPKHRITFSVVPSMAAALVVRQKQSHTCTEKCYLSVLDITYHISGQQHVPHCFCGDIAHIKAKQYSPGRSLYEYRENAR